MTELDELVRRCDEVTLCVTGNGEVEVVYAMGRLWSHDTPVTLGVGTTVQEAVDALVERMNEIGWPQ